MQGCAGSILFCTIGLLGFGLCIFNIIIRTLFWKLWNTLTLALSKPSEVDSGSTSRLQEKIGSNDRGSFGSLALTGH